MQIFSESWASAYQDAINQNPKYATTSQNWNHGALAMTTTFADGTDHAIILDLAGGECLSAQVVTHTEAQAQASLVIQGDLGAWQDVLNGKIQPLMAIMRGKLKLTKGSIGQLMPFTQSAIELVNSAQQIETEFPD